MKRSAATAPKIATGAVTARAVRDHTLLRGDLAPGATVGAAGPWPAPPVRRERAGSAVPQERSARSGLEVRSARPDS